MSKPKPKPKSKSKVSSKARNGRGVKTTGAKQGAPAVAEAPPPASRCPVEIAAIGAHLDAIQAHYLRPGEATARDRDRAARALLAVLPTTLAGAAALVRHVSNDRRVDWPTSESLTEWHRHLAEFLEELLVDEARARGETCVVLEYPLRFRPTGLSVAGNKAGLEIREKRP
jgi:hypothetical protein